MKNDYWRDRELKHIEKMIKDDDILAKKITSNQLRAMDEIQEQIDAFYGRYADIEGISMSEAKKRVNKLDIEKYERKAKRYVKERKFTKIANEEMRLYNATMQINRLELLKANIHLELLAMTSEEQRILFEAMTKSARAEYTRQSGILGETIAFNQQSINAIVNSSFLTATWSERLWDNQDALRSELDRLLNRGIIQGRNPRELARELRKKFKTNVYNSERLLRTEMARVQQDVFQDSMKQSGYDQYIYIAESSACPICSALDNEVFDLKDAEVGINIYPMHPNCRCSTSAYMDREALERDLNERGLFAEGEQPKIQFNEHISSKLTEEHKQHYEKVLQNAPKQEKELWDKYQGELSWANNLKGGSEAAYFRPSQGVTLNTGKDLEGNYFSKPGTVFWHEFGHNIDYLSGNHQSNYVHRKFASASTKLSNGKTLGDTVVSEVRKMTNTKKGNAVEKRHFLKQDMMVDYDKNIPSMATVSDLYGGATGNKLILGAGHDKNYWVKPKGSLFRSIDGKEFRSDKVGNEAFAEMYSATMRNAQEELKSFKKWLPESYEMYQELVEIMLKGGN